MMTALFEYSGSLAFCLLTILRDEQLTFWHSTEHVFPFDSMIYHSSEEYIKDGVVDITV